MADIDQYIDSVIAPEDDVLVELTRQTNLRTTRPRMISGHAQGELLKIIIKIAKPKRVLELGTFTGYSAICMAKGLNEGSILETIDNNDELEELAYDFFVKAGVSNKIIQHIGDCCEVLNKLNNVFDVVFIDADKREYIKYYSLLFEKRLVASGSIIIADNTLWSGKILEQIKENDKHSIEILKFNDFVGKDSRVEKILLPLRDGITIIYVK